jgi:hypothetical protein
MRNRRPARWIGALLGASLILGAVALPVLGEDPGAAPAASGKPDKPGKPDKVGKPDKLPGAERGPKAEKGATIPASATTWSGQVGTRTDDEGRIVYTLTVGSSVYDLRIGPRWWSGASNPLHAQVGKTAEIQGMQPGDEPVIHVWAVNGSQLRGAGKPAWAGGWKAVGDGHPGWSQEKADRWAERMKDGHRGWGPGGRPDKPASGD